MYSKTPQKRLNPSNSIPLNKLRSLLVPCNGIVTQPFSAGAQDLTYRINPKRNTQITGEPQTVALKESQPVSSNTYKTLLDSL